MQPVHINLLEVVKTEEPHGLILEPIVRGDHYVLGGYTGIPDTPILMPGGHGWGKYKPKSELQVRYGLETMNCSVFGTLNALETLAKFKGIKEFPNNCSERYSGIMAKTTPVGNDPHKVIESIRTEAGVITEEALPWTEDITTWEAYYSPSPMDPAMLALGKSLIKKLDIKHEWVFNGRVSNRQERLIEALSKGTVALTVYAWAKKGSYYVKMDGDLDNHWVQLLDYVEGKYWLIYDHYKKEEKKLVWDYAFEAAKVYYMEPKPERTTLLETLKSLYEQLLALLTPKTV